MEPDNNDDSSKKNALLRSRYYEFAKTVSRPNRHAYIHDIPCMCTTRVAILGEECLATKCSNLDKIARDASLPQFRVMARHRCGKSTVYHECRLTEPHCHDHCPLNVSSNIPHSFPLPSENENIKSNKKIENSQNSKQYGVIKESAEQLPFVVMFNNRYTMARDHNRVLLFKKATRDNVIIQDNHMIIPLNNRQPLFTPSHSRVDCEDGKRWKLSIEYHDNPRLSIPLKIMFPGYDDTSVPRDGMTLRFSYQPTSDYITDKNELNTRLTPGLRVILNNLRSAFDKRYVSERFDELISDFKSRISDIHSYANKTSVINRNGGISKLPGKNSYC